MIATVVPPFRLPRRALLFGALGSLASCATAKPILRDRSSMSDVRRIGLPKVRFISPS